MFNLIDIHYKSPQLWQTTEDTQMCLYEQQQRKKNKMWVSLNILTGVVFLHTSSTNAKQVNWKYKASKKFAGLF
jgi:hypothetical protein